MKTQLSPQFWCTSLRILFISLLLVKSAFVYAQSDSMRCMQVQNFFNEKSVLSFNVDSNYVVVFVNANCCTRCVLQITDDLRKNVRRKSNTNIVFLVRVGDDFMLRRDVMSKIGDDFKQDIFFDIEDNESIGIENKDRIKGNFKNYGINRTPSILLVQNGTEQVFQNTILFNERGDLQWSLLKQLK